MSKRIDAPKFDKGKPRKRFWSRLGKFLRNLFLLFLVVSVSWVVVDRLVPVYLTPLMIMRTVESIALSESPKNSKKWVSIDEISPNMVDAVVSSEDNLF